MFQDEASVFTAMRAGARGYVLKDADKDDILRALFAVGRGEAIFSPEVATRIATRLSATVKSVSNYVSNILRAANQNM
jgi:DNA-binding NarL/FixJ family response regulator